MAEQAILVQPLGRGGLLATEFNQDPAGASVSLSVSDNYKIANNGSLLLLLKNGGSNAVTVTVVTTRTVEGLAVADRPYSVPAGAEPAVLGPFKPDLYNDSEGEIDVSFSAITSVELAAIQVPV